MCMIARFTILLKQTIQKCDFPLVPPGVQTSNCELNENFRDGSDCPERPPWRNNFQNAAPSCQSAKLHDNTKLGAAAIKLTISRLPLLSGQKRISRILLQIEFGSFSVLHKFSIESIITVIWASPFLPVRLKCDDRENRVIFEFFFELGVQYYLCLFII